MSSPRLFSSTAGFRLPAAVANHLPAAPVTDKKSAASKQTLATPAAVPAPKRYSFDDNGGGYQGL